MIHPQFTPREQALFNYLTNFYWNPDNKNEIDECISIIEKKSDVSLRNIEQYITGKHCDLLIKLSYKAHIKNFRKPYFDPFRHIGKFTFNFDPTDSTKVVETTIGQLNFFRWVLENNIIDLIKQNV